MSDSKSDTETIKVKSENEKRVENLIKWTKYHEKILSEWADKAWCYGWLHGKSNAKYAFLMKLFAIPVIIISTITGTANYAQNRVPEGYANMYVIMVGTLNILVGIIGTIQQFLKINELNESHRVSSISWNKFHRNIRLELAKKPSERVPVGQMLKSSREEYDRLLETSPNIEIKIINKFKKTFQKKKDYNLITKPDICDELPKSQIYKRPNLRDIIRNKVIGNKELQMQAMQDSKDYKNNELMKNKEKEIKEFISKFEKQYDRKPLVKEIEELIELTEEDKSLLDINNEDDLEDYFNKFLKNKDESVTIDMLDVTIDA